MPYFSKEALGSILEIHIKDQNTQQKDIDACFLRIATFENTYSRFQKGNYLWELNHTGRATLNSEIKSLVELCKSVSKATDGYFDITLLPLLENAGYGIEENKLPENIGSEHIEITDTEIILHHNVMLDFGSFGKGYMLDICSHMLQKSGYQDFTLNFGGDIKVAGQEKIFLEDPLREGKMIGEILLEHKSFAASSGNRRTFGDTHHILNPKTGVSQQEILAVFTTHSLGVLADIYSTALFACPIDTALTILKKTPGLEALIIETNGKIHVSAGFQENMKLY